MKETIPFSIERVDTLGQGVSFDKSTGKVSFIPKTLPCETGHALITGKKGKKVQFAKLKNLEITSPKRIEPKCIHYQQCPGCAYLHTSYEDESQLKKQSYGFLFRKYFNPNKITYTQAPKRLGYRNRVQLHYDRSKKTFGYKVENNNLPVAQCQVAHPHIQDKMKSLYEQNKWMDLVKDAPNTGHIELYLKEQSVSIAINQRYAHEGFTQVFDEMNTKAIQSITEFSLKENILSKPEQVIIDLFGGDGNLTQMQSLPTLVIDYYTTPKEVKRHQNFLSQDLYSSKALSTICDTLKSTFNDSPDVAWLILDPPRSGLKNLNDYASHLKPQRISYLSCNPNTQVRDIGPLLENGWIIDSIEFLDFFPSTYHLESFVHLKKAH